MNDRELDALVAEKVMGWMWVTADGITVLAPPSHMIAYRENARLGKGGHIDLDARLLRCPPLPHYSTDIAAAWEVIEKLYNRGISIEISDMRHSPEEPGWWIELVRFEPLKESDAPKWVIDDLGGRPVAFHLWEHDCGAPTAPLAICLAALKAVGVQVPY